MANKVTVKITGKDLKELSRDLERIGRDALTPAIAAKIGRDVIKEMQEMIAVGLSPIRGKGRFAAYKATSGVSGKGKNRLKGIQNKYPLNQRKNFPTKGLRPVNLKLSGDFLRALKSRVLRSVKGPNIEIGFFDSKEAVKEQGHREGANGQPKRPIIPEEGEEFAVRVVRQIEEVVNEAIQKYVDRILRR